jgi:hypothetical protein
MLEQFEFPERRSIVTLVDANRGGCMRFGSAFLLFALALGACSRHPTYGRPTPRDSTPGDDPPIHPDTSNTGVRLDH